MLSILANASDKDFIRQQGTHFYKGDAQQPYYFVMRDSSMASDSVATNFEQIFATYSPSTERRVL